jgi:catechol 2,3-dioxygenase-like lactoylglutathione lyase family enzyme
VKVTRFHHVSVNTSGTDLGALVAFYGGLFGLPDEPRPEIPGVAGHWHAVGDQQLHLVAAAPAGTGIDPTGPHFCLAVEDLDDAIAELDARGIAYARAVQGAGIVQVWITDPAGNTIELQQDPDARRASADPDS